VFIVNTAVSQQVPPRYSRKLLIKGARYAAIGLAGLVFVVVVIPWIYHQTVEIQEAHSPVMKERTRIVWNDLQTAEAQSRQNSSDAGNYFVQRAYLYAQINTEGADPSLIFHVAQVVEASKEVASVVEAIVSETRKSHESADAVREFLVGLGTVLGAAQDNHQTLSQNAADGQTAGEIAGLIASGIGNAVDDSTIKSKYEPQLNRCTSRIAKMDSERAQLATTLTGKYKIQLLNAF
jgi:hypothetical protein